MSWVVVTPPSVPMPSLEEVKAHLRVDHSDDDLDLTSKIWGAITEFEDPRLGWLGTVILAREIEVTLAGFAKCIALPCGPILKDADHPFSIKYDDTDGVEQDLSDGIYQLLDPETSCRRIVLSPGQSWPVVQAGESAVRVRYWAGYVPTDSRIGNFRSAVKLHVQMMYSGDTALDVNLPDTIRRLLQPYRNMLV